MTARFREEWHRTDGYWLLNIFKLIAQIVIFIGAAAFSILKLFGDSADYARRKQLEEWRLENEKERWRREHTSKFEYPNQGY